MTAIICIISVIVGLAAILIGTHYILKAYVRAGIPAGGAYTHSMKREKILWKYDKIARLSVTYAVLVLVCCSTIFPFFWMISTSLKTVAEATNTSRVILFPSEAQWQNYARAFTELDILTGMKNTLIVEIGTIPIGMFASALVAYAFAKMRLRHKTFWLLFLMSGLMVPYASVLLPQYKIYLMLGLTNTLWPLILPSLFGNVSVMFFFIQFMRGIPNDLFEAAKLDGAGYFQSFVLVMLPNIWLPIICQVVFSFVSHWNDFFGPSIYLTSDATKTLQVKLYTFATNADKPLLYAASFITCLPLFVVYLCFQKFFVGSLAITGIKG